MNNVYVSVIYFIFTFMLFPVNFFCLLADKLKNQFIIITLHVYFSLRQYLATLKGFFAYLHDKFCLLGGRIKNKIVSFFDPRIRDPHSIIINILVLFAYMPIFISLLVVLVSYKIIFIPVLQVVVYICRATIVLRILKFIVFYLQKLDFRDIAVIELAMIPLRPLGTIKGVDFYLTQMSRSERKEFMRTYRKEYLNNIPELTAVDKKVILDQTDLYFLRGLGRHYSISSIARDSNVSGYPLAVHTTLTMESMPYPKELVVALDNAIIAIRPELREQLETVRITTTESVQYMVHNIMTVKNLKGMKIIERAENPEFTNVANVEGIACTLSENVAPLCKELVGVKAADEAALIIHRYNSKFCKPNEHGLSEGIVVPYLKNERAVDISSIIDTLF